MIGFYFDEHIARTIADTLSKRGYFAVMPSDIGMLSKDDDTEHLPYAIAHHLVLVTQDRGFAGRCSYRFDHPGVICLTAKIHDNVGEAVQILADFSDLYDPERDAGKVYWYS